jgi:hypothetical protein
VPYTSTNIVEDEMGEACSTHGEMRKACKILVGRPDGKISLGRPKQKLGIILKWILRKLVVGMWTRFICCVNPVSNFEPICRF